MPRCSWIRSLGGLVAAVLCGGTAASAAILIAVDDVAGEVYLIDPATAAATFVGPTGGEPSLTGLAFDTSSGTLYLSDECGGTDCGLATVDPSTGAAIFIGAHVLTSNVHGLAYDSLNDVLYGSDNGSTPSNLVTVNRATGVATLVGSMGLDGGGIAIGNVAGLAYDAEADVLYGINFSYLVTIDRATGDATVVGSHGASLSINRLGLEVDPDTGILYLGDESGDLYSVNKATGAVTLIGNSGIGIDSLAAISMISEISTLGTLGVIALAGALALAGSGVLRRVA